MKPSKPKVLGLIMARGGSKSLPKKNIYPCAGRPLIAYTIGGALQVEDIDRVIVSTDDEEIARVAREYGAKTPFMRPKELAKDLTPDLPVAQHAINWLKKNESWHPDIVVHLRPTLPFRSVNDLAKGIKALVANSEAQSVRSVCLPPHSPFKMYRYNNGDPFLTPILQKDYPEIYAEFPEPYNLPRQMLPVVWRHIGCVDIVRSDVIMNHQSMSGSKMIPMFLDDWRGVDIDSLDELLRAEEVIKHLRREGKEPWD